MKFIITWLQNNWYFYLLVVLGLSFYLYIIFLRFIRELNEGVIVSENISNIRMFLNISLALIFFCFTVILAIMLYKAITKNTKTSIFTQRLLKYVTKLVQFYEEVLETTLMWIVLNIPYLKEFLKYTMPYFNRFMRSNTKIKHTVIVVLIFIIPLTVSVCFFVDAYNNYYYFFSRSVTLLIIPLIISVILYVFKALSARLSSIWQKYFDIALEEDRIKKFVIIPGTEFSKDFEKYKTLEEKTIRMHYEFHFYLTLHQIGYTNVIWQKFQSFYKIPILACKLITIVGFFLGWTIISYNSIIL